VPDNDVAVRPSSASFRWQEREPYRTLSPESQALRRCIRSPAADAAQSSLSAASPGACHPETPSLSQAAICCAENGQLLGDCVRGGGTAEAVGGRRTGRRSVAGVSRRADDGRRASLRRHGRRHHPPSPPMPEQSPIPTSTNQRPRRERAANIPQPVTEAPFQFPEHSSDLKLLPPLTVCGHSPWYG